MFQGIDLTIGLRLDEDEEELGCDFVEHGIASDATKEFQGLDPFASVKKRNSIWPATDDQEGGRKDSIFERLRKRSVQPSDRLSVDYSANRKSIALGNISEEAEGGRKDFQAHLLSLLDGFSAACSR